jgi:hypothetical protein
MPASWVVRDGGDSEAFFTNWKMASPMDMTNEKKDSCRAFHAFKPNTPMASGMSVSALSMTNTMMGIRIFLSLCRLPAGTRDNDGHVVSTAKRVNNRKRVDRMNTAATVVYYSLLGSAELGSLRVRPSSFSSKFLGDRVTVAPPSSTDTSRFSMSSCS